MLYHTARDALDMFRAVVPCRFSDSLAAVPRLAMLLHNDCMYISHHLMTIGHQYRHKYGRLPCGAAAFNPCSRRVDVRAQATASS